MLLVLLLVIIAPVTWLLRSPGTPAAQTAVGASASTSASPAPAGPATSRPSSGSSTGAPDAEPISLRTSRLSAEPYQTVPIRGRYEAGAQRFLRVQRWSEGAWKTFPVPAKVKATGEFTAYVELETPGAHRLRLLQSDSGVASKPFVVVIKD
jgi:hypothetical protein